VVVKITARDGQITTYYMAATFSGGDLALACEVMGGWWLAGEIALGSFSARILSVSKIVIDSN